MITFICSVNKNRHDIIILKLFFWLTKGKADYYQILPRYNLLITINSSTLGPETGSFLHTWLQKGREWNLLEQTVIQLSKFHSRLIFLPAHRCCSFAYMYNFLIFILELSITIYLGIFRKEKSMICCVTFFGRQCALVLQIQYFI